MTKPITRPTPSTARARWRHRGAVALVAIGCVVAALGTLAVIAAGFALSFDAIRAVGIAAGMNEDIAWMLPVSIDGVMTDATITAIVLKTMGRRALYPWVVVIIGVAISVACNAAHARLMGGLFDLEPGMAQLVSAIPAVTLFLSVHLLITLALAVIAEPAPAEPRQDTAADMFPVSAPPADVLDRPVDAPNESPDGAASGVTYTPEQARTMALALKAANPDMKPTEIAPFVGRSARQVTRMLSAAEPERVNGERPEPISLEGVSA